MLSLGGPASENEVKATGPHLGAEFKIASRMIGDSTMTPKEPHTVGFRIFPEAPSAVRRRTNPQAAHFCLPTSTCLEVLVHCHRKQKFDSFNGSASVLPKANSTQEIDP
ncbi:hypothetical protein R1flu_023697 [Riccia fluitans]|uniref:Uncharacterized protein n=1 Tax=Riccia fluitans TaxID=41844 RepID=A0ABD1XSR5_9MARC